MITKRNWKEIVLDTGTVWDKENPIEGVYVGVEAEVGPKSSKLYTIETEDGEVKVWGSTVLDDKLDKVIPGAYIKIEYEGKIKSKSGNDYHSFKVFLDESTETDLPEGF